MSIYYPQAALSLVVTWEDLCGDPINTKTTNLNVIPKSVTVELNNYFEADTFKAELDYKSFPFDPRAIRSIVVQIYMEDVKSLYKNNRRTQIAPNDNPIFIGFADKDAVEFDSDNRKVMLEGRDYTSVFIDNNRVKPQSINLDGQVDKVIDRLVRELGQRTESIEVIKRPSTLKVPSLAKLARDLNKATSKKNKRKNEPYWDIIQRITRRAGLLCFIDRDKVVLTRPRNLYEGEKRVQMVYGNNLSSLRFHRKIGRQKAQNVRVFSLDVEGKKVISATLPMDAISFDFIMKFGNSPILLEQYDVNGKKIENTQPAPTLSFPLANIKDRTHLIEVGEGVFEEISRQHLEGELSTKEMLFREVTPATQTTPSSENKGEFRNITVGTPIEITVRQDDMDKIKDTKNEADRVDYLIRQNYPREIATEFARSLSKLRYVFYTRNVTMTINDSDGFSMDIGFINFIDTTNLAGGSKGIAASDFQGTRGPRSVIDPTAPLVKWGILDPGATEDIPTQNPKEQFTRREEN